MDVIKSKSKDDNLVGDIDEKVYITFMLNLNILFNF